MKMWIWKRTCGTVSVCKKDVSGRRETVTFTSQNVGQVLSKWVSSHVWKPQSIFYT